MSVLYARDIPEKDRIAHLRELKSPTSLCGLQIKGNGKELPKGHVWVWSDQANDVPEYTICEMCNELLQHHSEPCPEG